MGAEWSLWTWRWTREHLFCPLQDWSLEAGSCPLPRKPSQSPRSLSSLSSDLFGEVLAAPLASSSFQAVRTLTEPLLLLCGHPAPGYPVDFQPCVCNPISTSFSSCTSRRLFRQKSMPLFPSQDPLRNRRLHSLGSFQESVTPLLWREAGEGHKGQGHHLGYQACWVCVFTSSLSRPSLL